MFERRSRPVPPATIFHEDEAMDVAVSETRAARQRRSV